MKKRTVAVLFALLCGFGGTISAQDFTPINNDLSSMLGAIGQSILPNVQQTVLADQGIGAASLGNSRFFIGGSLGASFPPDGLLGKMSNASYQVLDIQGLISTIESQLPGGASSVGPYIDKLKTFFPDPDTKLVFGFRTVYGIEVLGNFSILPQFLTNFGTGLIPSKPSITLNALSAGIRVRKTLIEDTGGFPAISIGAGYQFANFNVGYTLGSASLGSGSYTLDLTNAAIKLGTVVNTAGIDLGISKKLLIFTPYLRFMPWYSWGSFNSTFGPFSVSVGGTPSTISPSSTFSESGLSLLLAGGVEINLGKFALVPAGSYNILDNTWSANLSTRLQF